MDQEEQIIEEIKAEIKQTRRVGRGMAHPGPAPILVLSPGSLCSLRVAPYLKLKRLILYVSKVSPFHPFSHRGYFDSRELTRGDRIGFPGWRQTNWSESGRQGF